MSRFSRLFLFLTLAAALSGAVGSTAQETPTEPLPPETHAARSAAPHPGSPMTGAAVFTVTSESGIPEIPFRLINNHLILPIRINGSEPLAAVLDTGMPTPGLLLIQGPRTRDLELPFDPQMKALIKGAGGEEGGVMASIVPGASLQLDGLIIEGTPIIALPERPDFGGYHDAIIGRSLFDRFVVELDHNRRLVRLHEPDSYREPPDAHILPLTLRHGMPYVTVQVTPPDGERFDAEVVVDLGASHAISLNTGWSEAITVPTPSLRAALGHGIAGQVEGDLARLEALELGGARLNNVLASFPVEEHQHPGGMDSRAGNLGSDLLRRFNTTFDYSRQRMLLVPNQSFHEPFEWDRSGIRLAVGRDLAVQSLVAGSPAEETGIQVGDIITHLDGQAVTSTDYGTVRKALMGEGEVTLTLDREGETVEVTLELRRLI